MAGGKVQHRSCSGQFAAFLELAHHLEIRIEPFPGALRHTGIAKDNAMAVKTEKQNPTLSIAIQAKKSASRRTPSPETVQRARFEDVDRFRRLAAGGFSIATGIPKVCTIH